MSGTKKASAQDVAKWMELQLKDNDILHLRDAVAGIKSEFGEQFINDGAISPAVLEALRKLTKDEVVWDSAERFWRWRENDVLDVDERRGSLT